MRQQTTQSVLMVAPTSFQFNEENAASNHFQHHVEATTMSVRQAAMAEFAGAVETLRQAGINVVVYEHTTGPHRPDAVFPNNWFTTWPDSRVYLYPMAAENRRLERSPDIIQKLRERFKVGEVTDLSRAEQTGHFLEATGAMVFDHVHKVAYGCISDRCDETLLRSHAKHLGYEVISFHAYGVDEAPVYHTNVLMSLHQRTAIVCFEAITDAAERSNVRESLEQAGYELIDISLAQLAAFCGNTLELRSRDGQAVLALSQTANNAFTPDQLRILGSDKLLLPMAIPTIERVGGGGVRCMLAEIFLPANR